MIKIILKRNTNQSGNFCEMEQLIQNQIKEGLEQCLYSNSTFLAERLFANSKTLLNLYLVANCYFQSGNTETCYLFLKKNHEKWKQTDTKITPNQRNIHYTFAMACIKLSKFIEAENSLLIINKQEPNDSTINYWLGVINRYTSRNEKAIEYFTKSLETNPLNWSAFENICELGGNIEPSFVFHPDRINLFQKETKDNLFTPKINSETDSTPIKTEFKTPSPK